MIVLSLFDGISCGQLALKRAGKKVSSYYASEIDEKAISVTMKHWPKTIKLGDVNVIKPKLLPKQPDLLMGGPPCQSLSIAGRNAASGLAKGQSVLFWKFIEILNKVKPKHFLMENVASMKLADKEIITKELGVEPIFINSSVVSGQSRKRLYWTNIPVKNIVTKRIYLRDLLEKKPDAKTYDANLFTIDKVCSCGSTVDKPVRLGHRYKNCWDGRVYCICGKSICLCANAHSYSGKTGLYLINGVIRHLTPLECERLQTLPDNYTEGPCKGSRFQMIGNAWTVDVISHLLGEL